MDCINKTTSFSIQKAAVIGAGTMGAGIAALVADAGIPVILLDIVPPKLTEEDVIKGVDTKSRTFRDRFAQAASASGEQRGFSFQINLNAHENSLLFSRYANFPILPFDT